MSLTQKLSACLLCLLMLQLLQPGATSLAQDSTRKKVTTEDVMSSFHPQMAGEEDEASEAAGPGGTKAHTSIRDSREAEYNAYSLHHMERSFTWQYYSSILIFIIVVSIVLMGLYLSYRQFKLQEWKTMRPGVTSTTEASVDKTEFTTTTFEVGKEGIKINSAVIGLIILTISLVFFFLYLKYVYPINVLALNAA